MHRFHDMSYKEIAVQLNISPKTVDYRIQQALKQLRIELKDYLPLIYLLFTWKYKVHFSYNHSWSIIGI